MLDQRGTGASTMPDAAQPITIADLVADIEALRTTLGFDALTIFGHSFGGFVAMAYASAHPTSVRGLLLVNSAPPDLSLEQKLDALRIARLTSDQRAALSALHAQPPGGAAENIRDQTRAMLPALFSDPQKATQFEPYLDSPEDYVPAVAAALEPDLAANGRVASLRDLHAPTLLAFGADDPGAALVVRALQAEFTAPQTALIAGAGHFPWIEQPKNFYNTVLNFLTANGLGGSNPL
jgi:proline iminopeptidase